MPFACFFCLGLTSLSKAISPSWRARVLSCKRLVLTALPSIRMFFSQHMCLRLITTLLSWKRTHAHLSRLPHGAIFFGHCVEHTIGLSGVFPMPCDVHQIIRVYTRAFFTICVSCRLILCLSSAQASPYHFKQSLPPWSSLSQTLLLFHQHQLPNTTYCAHSISISPLGFQTSVTISPRTDACVSYSVSLAHLLQPQACR